MWQHEAAVTASILPFVPIAESNDWSRDAWHFGKSRSEMGDMSTAPFGVDFVAWIYSHEGSKMWSIGPRDVRHEHCFWLSPGFSNSKFVNQASLSSGKVRTSLEHPLLYNFLKDTMKDTGLFSAGLTFSSSGCCGSLAALHTHTHDTSERIPPPLQLRGSAVLRFCHGIYANTIRYFQLDSPGTWFQSSHWKLPSCNHMSASQIESMFCWCFMMFFYKLCLWRWAKQPQKMKNMIFSKSNSNRFAKRHTFEVDLSKRREAHTRTLRTKPRAVWTTCWPAQSPGTSPICRRSPWRTRCWGFCSGTRGTDGSRTAAAKRCTASARSSQNSAPHCSATPLSTPRCAPRRRRIQAWRRRTASGTRKSSVSGCSRRASSGGDGCLWGGKAIVPTEEVAKVLCFSQQVTSQFYNSHSFHWLLLISLFGC